MVKEKKDPVSIREAHRMEDGVFILFSDESYALYPASVLYALRGSMLYRSDALANDSQDSDIEVH